MLRNLKSQLFQTERINYSKPDWIIEMIPINNVILHSIRTDLLRETGCVITYTFDSCLIHTGERKFSPLSW